MKFLGHTDSDPYKYKIAFKESELATLRQLVGLAKVEAKKQNLPEQNILGTMSRGLSEAHRAAVTLERKRAKGRGKEFTRPSIIRAKFYHHLFSCKFKASYFYEGAAEKRAREAREETGHKNIHAYACEYGQHWHIGHSDKSHKPYKGSFLCEVCGYGVSDKHEEKHMAWHEAGGMPKMPADKTKEEAL